MKKYILQTWLKIAGISAVSGLGYEDNKLQLVADNTNALYEYFIANDSLVSYSLDGNSIQTQPKETKYDFEALTKWDNTWYAFSSGSTINRNTSFQFNKFSKYATPINLSDLYHEMKNFSGLDDGNFNIEAVSPYKEDWLFLNRGNGSKNANYIFVVQGKNLTDDFNMYYFEFELPKIKNIPTGFSDAVVVNNTLFFIASAEASKNSTYLDGQIAGSIFGAIDLKKMDLLYTTQISDTDKFEGLTIINQSKKEITFALAADNDEKNTTETTIHKLTIQLKQKVK